MTAQEIRQKYLDFYKERGHKILPRASLVPQDDPTTLFTGSGMQPLVPYLLGQPHPEGKKLADSQTCFRAEDMDEVGDNRHTTFFEMLGNWSLGDYFKDEQLPWCWEFLTDVVGLDKDKLFITCFMGDEARGIPKDTESGELWQQILGENAKEVDLPGSDGAEKGMQGGRIFYYDAKYNWWSREGEPEHMRDGEPGGPDSEVFYDFGKQLHDKKFGEHCHPNCDCGRFLEITNNVFMTYRKIDDKFEPLPKPNVDFGGGLERIAAAANNDPDVFKISLLQPIIEMLEKISGQQYSQHQQSTRVIADHLRAAVWLAVDGVEPSNKERGYVLRRLVRRAVRYGFDIGIEQRLIEQLAPVVIDIYAQDFPEVKKQGSKVLQSLSREEGVFRQTLRNGLKEFEHSVGKGSKMFAEEMLGGSTPRALTGGDIFRLYDTHGFPSELSLEEAKRKNLKVANDWKKDFEHKMAEQRQRSQTAAQGMFKGGLADTSEEVVKLHTATHLMYQALKDVLGKHVVQRGSNITAERTRFDFSHPEKVTPEQIKQVEDIVNQKIQADLPVSWQELPTKQALADDVSGAFGDKYGEVVKVYTIGSKDRPFSREICGGPHVEHTGAIGAGGKKFKITKEESSSAGVRRVKATLQ